MPEGRICHSDRCSAHRDSILMIASRLKVRSSHGREKRRSPEPQYVRWTCPRCGRNEVGEAVRASPSREGG